MARSGVTLFDVEKAAAQLVEAGKSPTVDSVRGILGTGSKSTIAPLLKQWKAEQSGAVEATQVGLPEPLVAAVVGLYEGMQQTAQAQVDTIETKAKLEIETTNLEKQRITDKYSKLQTQEAENAATISQLEQSQQALQTELAEAHQANADTNISLDTQVQLVADRDEQIRQLNSQLSQAQSNLEHYRESTQEQRAQERADFEHQRSTHEENLRVAKAENHTLTTRLEAKEEELADEKTMRAQLVTDKQWLKEQNQQQAKSIEGHQQTLQSLKTQLAVVQQRNETLEKADQALNNQLLTLVKALAVAQDKNTTLTTNNNDITRSLENLRTEYKTIEMEKANLEGQYRQLMKSSPAQNPSDTSSKNDK